MTSAREFLTHLGYTNAAVIDIAASSDSFCFAYSSGFGSNIFVQVLRRDGSVKFAKP
jgi:hypothetical protein